MGSERDAPDDPNELSVDDILQAPFEATDPAHDIRDGHVVDDARSALWELDFALQEVDWLARDFAAHAPLLESIVAQISYSARYVERFPVWDVGLPHDLASKLAERFEALTDALRSMPSDLAADARLVAAYDRLRTALQLRGVEVD